MATVETPDYLTSPNAVLGDGTAKWRYGRAPDYTNTRSVYEQTKSVHHEAGSLPELVQNLVKNWEIEASFKVDSKDWRTIDLDRHSFAVNGRPAITPERFLQLGTYNAVLSANQYYSPEKSDFASSHKTFKRMMPTFAWEVLEVYSGPPRVAFKWRHWGVMKNDYVGFNDQGEKVTAKAHGGPIEITGISVANVDARVRIQALETWFDPLDMFRQIAPQGIVTRLPRKTDDNRALADQLDDTDDLPITVTPPEQAEQSGAGPAQESAAKPAPPIQAQPQTPSPARSMSSTSKGNDGVTLEGVKKMLDELSEAFAQLTGAEAKKRDPSASPSSNSSWVGIGEAGGRRSRDEEKVDASDAFRDEEKGVEGSAGVDVSAGPGAGEAVPGTTEEARDVHAEMSHIGAGECPFMNRE